MGHSPPRVKVQDKYRAFNRVKLKVDGEFIDMLEVGDYFVLGNTPVTLDSVEIFEEEADYVEFCVG